MHCGFKVLKPWHLASRYSFCLPEHPHHFVGYFFSSFFNTEERGIQSIFMSAGRSLLAGLAACGTRVPCKISFTSMSPCGGRVHSPGSPCWWDWSDLNFSWALTAAQVRHCCRETDICWTENCRCYRGCPQWGAGSPRLHSLHCLHSPFPTAMGAASRDRSRDHGKHNPYGLWAPPSLQVLQLGEEAGPNLIPAVKRGLGRLGTMQLCQWSDVHSCATRACPKSCHTGKVRRPHKPKESWLVGTLLFLWKHCSSI